MAQVGKRDRNAVTRIRKAADDAKKLARKLGTRAAEIKRQKAFDRKAAARLKKEIDRCRKEVDDLLKQIEEGDLPDSRAKKRVLETVVEIASKAKDLAAGKGTPATAADGLALSISLAVAALLALSKKLKTET